MSHRSTNSSKFVNSCFSYFANRQANKGKNITSLADVKTWTGDRLSKNPRQIRQYSVRCIRKGEAVFSFTYFNKETQLSLTNRVTRLEISEGHQTWYYSMLGMVFY